MALSGPPRTTIPLFLANRPVILPYPSHYEVLPTFGTLYLEDPLSKRLDPTAFLSDEDALQALQFFSPATHIMLLFSGALLISYPPTVSLEKLVLPEYYGGLWVAKMHNRPCMTIESSSDGLKVDDINVGRVAVHGVKSGDTTSLNVPNIMVKVCGGDRLEVRGAKYGQTPPPDVPQKLIAEVIATHGASAHAGAGVVVLKQGKPCLTTVTQIGRASCRERV